MVLNVTGLLNNISTDPIGVAISVYRETSGIGFYFDAIMFFVFLGIVLIKTQSVTMTLVAAIILGSGMTAMNMLPIGIIWLLRGFVAIALASILIIIYKRKSGEYG
jgi:hypothetical protein